MDIKKLIIEYLSAFSLERLINIVNFRNGICHSCKQYCWLEPSYKHAYWGCKVSIIKFDENYHNCHGEKFEPNKSFLELLKD